MNATGTFSGNKLIDSFERQMQRKKHKLRLREAYEKGDQRLTETIYDPNVFILGTEFVDKYASCHKRNKSKTIQIQEDNCTKIEKQNRMLLEKIKEVKYRRSNFDSLQIKSGALTAGKPSLSPSRATKDPKQLLLQASASKRKVNTKERHQQNDVLLNRLFGTKASFNVIKWDNARRKQESEMERYTKFPHIFKVDKYNAQQANERENMLREYDRDTSSQHNMLSLRNSYKSTFSSNFHRYSKVNNSVDVGAASRNDRYANAATLPAQLLNTSSDGFMNHTQTHINQDSPRRPGLENLSNLRASVPTVILGGTQVVDGNLYYGDTSVGVLDKKDSILKNSVGSIVVHQNETDPTVEGQLLSDYLEGDVKGNIRPVKLMPAAAQTQRESPSKISWLDQQQASNLVTKLPTVQTDLDGHKTKYSNASIMTEIKNLVEAESSASAAQEDSQEYAQGDNEPSQIPNEGGQSPLAYAQKKKNKYSKYINMPKYQRMLTQVEPLIVQGRHNLPTKRRVLWKNICVIGQDQRECIVEFSQNKLKFFIVALDMESTKIHVIELWRAQAEKVVKACDGSLAKLMTYLDFKFGVLKIKEFEMLLQYQLYMPSELQETLKHQEAVRNSGSFTTNASLISKIALKRKTMLRNVTNRSSYQTQDFQESSKIELLMEKNLSKRKLTNLTEIKKQKRKEAIQKLRESQKITQLNQDSQLEFEAMQDNNLVEVESNRVGEGLKGAIRNLYNLKFNSMASNQQSDEREVDRLKQEIDEFKKQEKRIQEKRSSALRKDAKAYVNEMVAIVCAKALKERAEKAAPLKAAAELERVLDEELPVDTFKQEPGEHVNFIEQRDSVGTGVIDGTQSSRSKGADDEEPSQPTIDPQIQKADKIIQKVGLMEVREVYESEMDRTQMLDTNSQKPNIESRMKVLENQRNSYTNSMSAVVKECEENWKKAENEASPKRKSLIAPDPQEVLLVLQGHQSQGQILTENDHEESDEENVIQH